MALFSLTNNVLAKSLHVNPCSFFFFFINTSYYIRILVKQYCYGINLNILII